MRDNKITIPIIVVLIIAIISIGIAFATFSTTLNIGGHATVDATSWEIVFEGKTNPNVMDAPTTVGTAAQVTLPTIKNNATEISTYSVTLKTPGDSITYDFKIHNKGSYDATVSSLVIAGVSNPSSPISGSALVTDSAVAQANANTLSQIEYKFYYTDDNTLVGQNPTRDCLAAGETENVSLRIVFSNSSATDTSILPSTDLVLDNLGVTMVYTQGQNCTNNNQGGNGGGNSGGNQPSGPTTTGGGTSNTSPTVTPTKITGGNVSVPTSGDSVTYTLEYIVETCTTIDSITIPSASDFAAANPGMDSSSFNGISVAVTDANGDPISNMQVASSETIKVIISNSGTTLNSSINIPDINIAYTGSCSSSAGTQYLLSVSTATNPSTYTWASNKSELTSLHYEANDVYVKKVNDALNVCIVINSVEHCFDGSTTESSLRSYCSSLGGTIEEAIGSWTGVGVTCYDPVYDANDYDVHYFNWQIEVSDAPYAGNKYIYVSKVDPLNPYNEYSYNANSCRIILPLDNNGYTSGCDYNGSGFGLYR